MSDDILVSEDKTVLAPIEIPGMKITFQSPIGPQGKMIGFDVAADALIPLGALNERLDVIAKAVRRQDAFEQLRLDQQSLRANRKLLEKARKARAEAQAALEARLEVVRASTPRRREVEAVQAAPANINAVAQHDQRILEIEGQIAGCEERIPFWKAILLGREPLDLELDPANDREAAE